MNFDEQMYFGFGKDRFWCVEMLSLRYQMDLVRSTISSMVPNDCLTYAISASHKQWTNWRSALKSPVTRLRCLARLIRALVAEYDHFVEYSGKQNVIVCSNFLWYIVIMFQELEVVCESRVTNITSTALSMRTTELQQLWAHRFPIFKGSFIFALRDHSIGGRLGSFHF